MAKKSSSLSLKQNLKNPFGLEEERRPARELLRRNVGIGIHAYDRGHEVWNPHAVAEDGTPKPAWEWEANETLECVVQFGVSDGSTKGVGDQIVPVCEFADYVQVLRDIQATNFEEPEGADQTTYVPTPTVLRSSFRMIRPKKVEIGSDGKEVRVEDPAKPKSIVSLRSRNGRGMKPYHIPRDEFAGFLEEMEGILEALPRYEQKAWSNYEAAKAAEPADPESQSE